MKHMCSWLIRATLCRSVTWLAHRPHRLPRNVENSLELIADACEIAGAVRHDPESVSPLRSNDLIRAEWRTVFNPALAALGGHRRVHLGFHGSWWDLHGRVRSNSSDCRKRDHGHACRSAYRRPQF